MSELAFAGERYRQRDIDPYASWERSEGGPVGAAESHIEPLAHQCRRKRREVRLREGRTWMVSPAGWSVSRAEGWLAVNREAVEAVTGRIESYEVGAVGRDV